MTARRLGVSGARTGLRRLIALTLTPAAVLVLLSGCGHRETVNTPNLSSLPLVPGSAIVARSQQCDSGANAYCAMEVVVVDHRYPSSDQLMRSERRRLEKKGWVIAAGDIGDERGADSPGHKLHVTYATASEDLTGIDLGWIHRSQPITLALSHAMFDQEPALSMMLELGPT